MKWEYKVIAIQGKTLDSLQDNLNDLGQNEWELSVIYERWAIFKRPLKKNGGIFSLGKGK